MRTARQELLAMKKLSEAMPLYDSIEPVRTCLIRIQGEINIKDGKVILESSWQPRRVDVKEVMDAVRAIHNGASVRVVCGPMVSDMGCTAEGYIPRDIFTTRFDSQTSIASMVEKATAMRKDLVSMFGKMISETASIIKMVASSTLEEASIDPVPVRVNKKDAQRIAEYGIDIAIAKRTLENLARILSTDEVAWINDIDAFGPKNIRRYEALEKHLMKERNGRRHEYFQKMVTIACPNALSEMKSALDEMGRKADICPDFFIQDDPFLPNAKDPSSPAAKKDDAISLASRFPNLYKKMLRPTTDEQAWKAMRNKVHRLMRIGVDPGFIAGCFRDGKKDEDAIFDSFLRSHESEDVAPLARHGGNQVYFRPDKRMMQASVAPVAIGRQDARTKEEFLGRISFSAETDTFIRSKGFDPEDIVFAICKGFEFGKGNSCNSGAVGAAHYRGVYVRNNIRRCMDIRHGAKTAPSTNEMIEFLKSIDVVRDFGTTTAKTKDDAMSVNTNPDSQVGKDILRALNAAFIDLRASSRPPDNGKKNGQKDGTAR